MLNYFGCDGSANPLNQYQLHEELGKGTYGIVYRAVNLATNETVAIKQPTQRSGDIFKRFRNETEFYIRMKNSPYILKMLDFNIDSFSPFLVTEFCNLGNVRTRLWEMQINRIRTIALLWQLSSALSDVHRLGMLHRDIKPENLMLKTDSQNNWIIKLGDPGLACFPARSAFDFGVTRTAKGTESYIAPELFFTGAVFTESADTFSFGITACEMLTGQKILAGSKISGLGEQLDSCLSRMMSLNPQERPSMKQLKKEFSAIYQNEVKQSERRNGIALAVGALSVVIGSYIISRRT